MPLSHLFGAKNSKFLYKLTLQITPSVINPRHRSDPPPACCYCARLPRGIPSTGYKHRTNSSASSTIKKDAPLGRCDGRERLRHRCATRATAAGIDNGDSTINSLTRYATTARLEICASLAGGRSPEQRVTPIVSMIKQFTLVPIESMTEMEGKDRTNAWPGN